MSAPEINYKQLELDAALHAEDCLMGAAGSVALLLEMPTISPAEMMKKHPQLVAVFALLAHMDERAEERKVFMEMGVAALQEIAEGVDMLCACAAPGAESATVGHAAMPKSSMLLPGQSPARAYDALKAEFIRLNPDCSIEEHVAAMERFARLVGL